MLEMKKIQKYVKEKLNVGEKIKKEKEKKSHNFSRQIKIKEDIFDMEINMILIEEKIKFRVKEIQDNLKNNPIIYETFLELNDLSILLKLFSNPTSFLNISNDISSSFIPRGNLNDIIILFSFLFKVSFLPSKS